MSGKLIALIYFYLISAAALALIVIGIFNSVNYFVNTTQFEKYPLLYRNENCDLPYATDMYSMPVRPEGIASPSAKEQEEMKAMYNNPYYKEFLSNSEVKFSYFNFDKNKKKPKINLLHR